MLNSKIADKVWLHYYKNILVIKQFRNMCIFKWVNQSKLNKILAEEHDDLAVIYNADKLTQEQLDVLDIKMPISKIEAY